MHKILAATCVATAITIAGLAVPTPAAAQSDRSPGPTTAPSQNAEAACLFYSDGDNVHISSANPPTASGHGYWYNGDCPATQANVTITLQIKRGGIWFDVGGSQASRVVYAGGGSSNWANARAICQNRDSHQWRSVVDVDLIGVADDPLKFITPEQWLYCFA